MTSKRRSLINLLALSYLSKSISKSFYCKNTNFVAGHYHICCGFQKVMIITVLVCRFVNKLNPEFKEANQML